MNTHRVVPPLIAFAALAASPLVAAPQDWIVVDAFERPDSRYHGDAWETLNPGYWQVLDGALRRRLHNVGDRNPVTSFPWHYETHRGRPMPRAVDPSLPMGMIWDRAWWLGGDYALRAEFTVRALAPRPEGESRWKQEQPGYAFLGLCFGGKSLYESRQGGTQNGVGAWFAAWRDDGSFGIFDHAQRGLKTVRGVPPMAGPGFAPGDRASLEVEVRHGERDGSGSVTARLTAGEKIWTAAIGDLPRSELPAGLFGLVGRGLLDFQVDRVLLRPDRNLPRAVSQAECHVCYCLGDTLRREGEVWKARFLALFRNDGERAELRIADTASPSCGWPAVAVAGTAPIVTNDFRIATAVIDATLPAHPGKQAHYFTIWKDGRDVTADPRVTSAAGRAPGTGLTDPAPESGDYVGRLPRLAAPYRLAGLGGHAIHGGSPDLKRAGRFQENWVHDQPTPDAYRHLEEYDLQILVWDDDVWYLELLFPPPSTHDAYKVISYTIGGPTTRWQMMRHWNTITLGDHDHGMDDVKGPEQWILRQRDDLGQDAEYMRRNFRINSHLVAGDEDPSGTENPKRWRRWKLPNGDFSIVLLDARLWRNSQDTSLWAKWGWGHDDVISSRDDPTRTLLGEEQFAFLHEVLRTDSSPLLLMVGINCMHSVFGGVKVDQSTGERFVERDRVAADYAGWARAGADRVLTAMGARGGVVSVYGDIHLASIVRDVEQRVTECSFGPIGRLGSRRLKRDFGRRMRDFEGREVEVQALYHDRYGSPDLEPREGPKIWNFLEMEFDPRASDPSYALRIRNIVDAPDAAVRGGGEVRGHASETGRPITSRLPEVHTLPAADVLLLRAENGAPIRAMRSRSDGSLPLTGLIDVAPGTTVLLTAHDGEHVEAQRLRTLPLR